LFEGQTNAALKLFADTTIPGAGSNVVRLVDTAFDTGTAIASVTTALTNYAPGLLGLFFEDNSNGQTGNTVGGGARFDNFYVASTNIQGAVTAPVVTGLRLVGSNIQADFTGAADDVAATFVLETAATPSGLFAEPIPTPSIVLLNPGVFRVTTPISGQTRFWRIKRLPQ